MMTIRRQWLLVLTITAVLAVCINSVVLASLINRYFLTYTTENYNYHISQIEELSKNALTDNAYSARQLSVQLESHLDDPIVSIKLYNNDGRLVASAENDPDRPFGMMNGMMNGMMGKTSAEVDSFQISSAGVKLGQLNITRYSTISNSVVSSMFKASLVRNSFFSFGIVLFVLMIIGVYISRKLSRDLTNTASQALDIDLGNRTDFKPSKVKEIRIIQSSLEALRSKLKIKQIGRKRLVDELVHQTRTPLTILKAHLEGLEDGIIAMSPEEIKICEAQIESITTIISNMSMMLDADRPADTSKAEETDISSLLGQIISGLKVQFEKKNISLQLLSHQKVTAVTDKYKLSQCIYNVLTNAYKFTDPTGSVEISYTATESELTISVKDNGIGISAQDKAHLFDAYFRGSNAVSNSGEGLGLFIAKENLEQLGGTITVESEAGQGSTFIIRLPVKIMK